jgi:death-on-curing protein
MARSGSPLIFPSQQDIIYLNRRLIETYGGSFLEPDNFHNRNNLEWVLEAIQYPLFNQDLYPTISHKAAILAWTINDGHVFHDGNKRTSMFTAFLFIDGNRYHSEATNKEVIDIAMAVAIKHETGFTLVDLTTWFETHIR